MLTSPLKAYADDQLRPIFDMEVYIYIYKSLYIYIYISFYMGMKLSTHLAIFCFYFISLYISVLFFNNSMY